MMKMITTQSYGELALPHLEEVLKKNQATMEKLVERIEKDVQAGKSLFIFGSGHSSLLTMEMYHRAGGASFVIPVFADFLLPTAGPPVVRQLERSASVANVMLARANPEPSEMIWIMSQSGINPAVVDFALEAKRKKLFTVAFTGLPHSQAVASRHPSQKRLFEVCDEVIDLGGVRGDACLEIAPDTRAGPLSGLTSVLLGHSILTTACARLEAMGVPCTYTSVNTPEGEKRNRALEEKAMLRDPLLRG